MDHLVDPLFLGRSKQIEGPSGVAFKERFGVGNAPIDVGLRCKVHHDICILQSLSGESVVGEIPLDKSIARVPPETLDIGRIASGAFEVYVGDSEILSGLDHVMDEIASYET